MTWQLYASPTTVGTILAYQGIDSPQLGNRRDLTVYLPPSYATRASQRYPVIYMHDGQNLFDEATSFAGEWRVDETMENLAKEGLEAIIVGVPNMGAGRLAEYSPFRDQRHGGGQGRAYLRFLIDTVKPLIDQDLRTLSGRAHTGIFGSSMGGLISLYAFFAFPEHFGFVGAMSPSLWFARGRALTAIRRSPPILGQIYLDVGSAEPARTVGLDGDLYALLIQKGYRPEQDLRYVLDEGAGHTEAAWARRLPDALRFLLAGRADVAK
jgi:predicted alpha/beta superfamily hydrolase